MFFFDTRIAALLLIISAPLLLFASCTTENGSGEARAALIKADRTVALHEAPAADSTTLKKLDPGSFVTVIDNINSIDSASSAVTTDNAVWLPVLHKNTRGWIRQKDIEDVQCKELQRTMEQKASGTPTHRICTNILNSPKEAARFSAGIDFSGITYSEYSSTLTMQADNSLTFSYVGAGWVEKCPGNNKPIKEEAGPGGYNATISHIMRGQFAFISNKLRIYFTKAEHIIEVDKRVCPKGRKKQITYPTNLMVYMNVVEGTHEGTTRVGLRNKEMGSHLTWVLIPEEEGEDPGDFNTPEQPE